MNLYRIAKSVVALVFFPLYRIKVIGKHHIPRTGPVIICSNHISNLDPPVVGITSTRDISFMAKDSLFQKFLLGKLLLGIKAFPVKRGGSDRAAIRKGLALLKDNHTLGLFPEGTRSKTGELGKPLAGVGFFALRSEAKVVPCYITGPYKPFHRQTVIYGKPMEMDVFREQKQSAKEVSEAIMAEIGKIKDEYQSNLLDKQ